MSDELRKIVDDMRRKRIGILFAPAELHPNEWRKIRVESVMQEDYYKWVMTAPADKLMTFDKFREILTEARGE